MQKTAIFLFSPFFIAKFAICLGTKDLSRICGRPSLQSEVEKPPRRGFIADHRNPEDNPPGTWPWMGSLGYYDANNGVRRGWTHFCGVSLVSTEFALTAAHCISPDNSNGTFDWRVLFGVTNFDELSNEGLLIHESPVKQFLPHPSYNQRQSYFDVALIELRIPVQNFTDSILPICLPSDEGQKAKSSGITATIAGWGKVTLEANATSRRLRSTNVTVFSQGYCNRTHDIRGGNILSLSIRRYLPRLFTSSLLCTGDVVSVT